MCPQRRLHRAGSDSRAWRPELGGTESPVLCPGAQRRGLAPCPWQWEICSSLRFGDLAPQTLPLFASPLPQYETGLWRGESPRGSPGQTDCSRESPSRSACLFYKLSPTDPSQGRLDFLFFLNVYIFFFQLAILEALCKGKINSGEAGNPRGSSVAVFPADKGPCVPLQGG